MADICPSNRESFDSICAKNSVTLPYSDNTKVLCDKIKINKKEMNNRIVYQAMEGCDGTYDGEPGELTKRRYMRFANGGAGLIWFEATAVLNEGRANPRQMFINEKTLDSFKRLTAEIKNCCFKANGFETMIICQLTHSGRYSKPNGTPEPLIAYNNPIFENDKPIDSSKILSDDYLDRLSDSLANGAVLASKAGFDGADIKSCHRYLLSELLSAYTRAGKYGGSFENRTRMLRQTVSAAKTLCGDNFIIASRLNVYDGFPYPYGFGINENSGITPDYTEPVRLAEMLENEGLSLLDVTMGNPYFNPHVNRPFTSGTYQPPEHPIIGVHRMLTGTAQIKKALKIPVVCSGISWLGAVSPNVVSGCINDGWFTLAGYGRETLAYPDVAKDICGKGYIEPSRTCIACGKCTEIMRRPGGTPGCVIRDSGVYMPIYKKLCMDKGENK